jgi:hypothetical protein
MADWWGRRVPIAIGCIIMIAAAFLGAFANGYGSKCTWRSSLLHVILRTCTDWTQCTRPVDSFLDLATAWLRWPPQSCSLKFAILNIVDVSPQSITVFGTWVQSLLHGLPGAQCKSTTIGLGDFSLSDRVFHRSSRSSSSTVRALTSASV